MWESVSKIAETVSNAQSRWLVLFFMGCIFVLLGTTNGIEQLHITVERQYRFLYIAVGGFFVVTALTLVFHEQIGSDKKKDDAIGKSKTTDYGVSVTYPANGAQVHFPLTISGKCSVPFNDDVELWLFSMKPNEDGGYWSQGRVKITGLDWSYDLREESAFQGNVLRFQLFLVGKNGRTLIELYRNLNDKRFSFPMDTSWRPITEFTDDVVKATDPITVFRV